MVEIIRNRDVMLAGLTKHKMRMVQILAIMSVFTLIIVFSFHSVSSTAQDNLADKGIYKKIDNQLHELIDVQSSANIRVVIETLPGRTSEIIEWITAKGALVEASHQNFIQVLTSPELIYALAENEAVIQIRTPLKAI